MSDPPRSDAAPRRALAVLNPAAGRHSADTSQEKLETAFAEAGWEVDVRRTEGEGDATRFARDACDGDYELVAAAGGDGTVMEVVQGLVDAGGGERAALPLLIAPLGTGNGLASTLGVPASTEQAVARSLEGALRTIDLGRLVERDRVFAIFAGAGLDAGAIRDADRTAKDRFGPLAYVAEAVRHAFTQEKRRIRIELDGEAREVDAHTVMAFNASGKILSVLEIGPRADPADGRFEVVVIDSEPGLGTLGKLLELAQIGTRTLELEGTYHARRLRVDADPPLPVHADGEPLGETPFEIEMLPQALEVWVPPEEVEGGDAAETDAG